MKKPHYPLSQFSDTTLQAASGKDLEEINIENLLSGDLTHEDLQIHSQTLVKQARIAEEEGFQNLAKNLLRASELTRVPHHTLLSMYEALRPGRSTIADLNNLADLLEKQFDAPNCANFIRQAAAVYTQRNLTKD
jgi:propanediol dehydratase small subunit